LILAYVLSSLSIATFFLSAGKSLSNLCALKWPKK
jgi:hypothetical protein